MFEVLQPYLENAVSAIIGGLVMWWPNRKKSDSEVKSSEIDNGKKLIDIYKDNIDDIKKLYQEREDYLKKDFDQKFLDMKTTFDARIIKVEELVNEWRTKYYKLKADFDKYKKEHQ